MFCQCRTIRGEENVDKKVNRIAWGAHILKRYQPSLSIWTQTTVGKDSISYERPNDPSLKQSRADTVQRVPCHNTKMLQIPRHHRLNLWPHKIASKTSWSNKLTHLNRRDRNGEACKSNRKTKIVKGESKSQTKWTASFNPNVYSSRF